MSWLKRILGSRQEEVFDPDEEPARVDSTRFNHNTPPPKPPSIPKISPKPVTGSGFDPYNSGSFQRDDAWSRVNRK